MPGWSYIQIFCHGLWTPWISLAHPLCKSLAPPLNLGSSIWWYTPKNSLLKYTSCSTSCLFTGGVSVCSCTEDAGCLSFALDGYDQWSGGLPRLWELLQPQWLQRLLLFGPDPQHRAPGPALRRSAHCTRPWLHVLLGAHHKFTIFSCCLFSTSLHSKSTWNQSLFSLLSYLFLVLCTIQAF